MEAIILIGIQATGKSTFFKQNFADTHVRINLDMLKSRRREELLLDACIEGKTKFVVDNTNVSRETRARYIQPAKQAGFKVVGYYFSSKAPEAVSRNRERGLNIPPQAIYGTAKRLEIPHMDEGFDELFYVTLGGDGFSVEEWQEEA
ncbi:MAG: AAA family ATPase [Chitinivibrionales bacterium]|nr:AAA family ATPase [Chitinivibrionales bacterium]